MHTDSAHSFYQSLILKASNETPKQASWSPLPALCLPCTYVPHGWEHICEPHRPTAAPYTKSHTSVGAKTVLPISCISRSRAVNSFSLAPSSFRIRLVLTTARSPAVCRAAISIRWASKAFLLLAKDARVWVNLVGTGG